SLAEILFQARGEKVEVVLQQSATSQPSTLTGVIVGVEQPSLDGIQRWSAGNRTTACKPSEEAAAVEHLLTVSINLWCAEGMRSVKLSDIQRVRFLNPVMDSEVKKASTCWPCRTTHKRKRLA